MEEQEEQIAGRSPSSSTASDETVVVEPANATHINELPDVVLGLIFGHLKGAARQAMHRTCKAWHDSPSIQGLINFLSIKQCEKSSEDIASFPKGCRLQELCVESPSLQLFQALLEPHETAMRARERLTSVERLRFMVGTRCKHSGVHPLLNVALIVLLL